MAVRGTAAFGKLPKVMAIVKDFRDFALKGNVVDMAIGVIIGAAFGKIVTATVDDLFMPVLGSVLNRAGGEWREMTVTPFHIKVGHLGGTVLDFVIVAFVIFLLVTRLTALLRPKAAAPAPVATKTCPECLETIPLAAKRCRACTAVVGAV
jgi:large conductance mechanosensitive channel